MIGRTLSHYRIEEKLGQGGMGIVYRARDTRLERNVAIKILPPETIADPERKHRFEREARSASALNHPNIVTIHDIDTADGVDFIAMEYVDGEPLERILARGRLPLEEAVDHAVQIAGALAAAHSAGIVHRDIKPANLMVTRAGQVKVLDFGLAKLVEPAVAEGPVVSAGPTATGVPRLTRQGVVLGTLAYMSPEQAEGKPVDARSDVFSFGAVFYEMLTGRRPFQADSNLQTLTAILRDAPPPLRSIRPDVPADLERILLRCLEKKPDARYASAAELAEDLGAFRSRRIDPGIRARSLRRRRFAVALIVALLALAAAGSWLWLRRSKTRWARDVALPEIARLVEKGRFVAAIRLAADAERYAPDEVARLRRDYWVNASVKTEPSGADVSFKEYTGPGEEWQQLGRSPIGGIRIPFGYYRWKISKSGFQPLEAAAPAHRPLFRRLDAVGSVPTGMVRVPGGVFELRSLNPVKLDDYWLDEYEVTNAQFKKFLDGGGYSNRQYWKEPFVKDGRTLSWEDAMAECLDGTGRPGPATWELGSYPEGRGDFPVHGVSWYEAAAYAEFAGKRLPTVYHWYEAAGIEIFSDILRASNFGGQGPVRVGSYPGLAPFGNYDMAGNVKEWCWNATGEKRYLLGGAWSDPSYLFWEEDAQVPFDRSATNGFRCARYPSAPPETQMAPIGRLARIYEKEKPVSDEVFKIYKSFYSYDRSPLDAKVESTDDSSPYWRKEKVSFRAAYGSERVPAYLFLPRNAVPP